MMEDMANGHLATKNQRTSNSILDKNAEEKPKTQNKPKPKEETNLKPVEKPKDPKKVGSQIPNNQSVVMNGKDKNKKNGQEIKSNDKVVKPIPPAEKH